MAFHPILLTAQAPPRLPPTSITQHCVTINAGGLATLITNPKVALPKGTKVLTGGFAAFTEASVTFGAFVTIGNGAGFTFNAFQAIVTGPTGFRGEGSRVAWSPNGDRLKKASLLLQIINDTRSVVGLPTFLASNPVNIPILMLIGGVRDSIAELAMLNW